MPFRMVFANPFVLAAVTVVAIGVITYQILTSKKRVPTRGRIRYRGDDSGPHGPDNPDETPKVLSLNTVNDNRTFNESKSATPSNASSGVRKRTVATQNPDNMSEAKNLKVDCNESKSHPTFSNSFDGNSELSADSSRNSESQYPSQQNVIQKVDNISLVNSNKTFVANINDEDSDSSESNNSRVNSKKKFVANIDNEDSDSSESGNSLDSVPNQNRSIGLNESNCNKASSSTTRYENISTPSPSDSSEEIYKKDVCSYLKTDIHGENSKEKCFKNFSDEESDVSESSFSVSSEDSNGACAFKKPKMCKGCLEDFANAVAYPCEHCYLCLDCAVKVHRIYKKCTVCLSVIKTFEQLKM